MHAELQRRQREAQLTLQHMQETQAMIGLLIEAQQKRLYVDDYVLGEWGAAEH